MIRRICENVGLAILGALLLAIPAGCARDGGVIVEWADLVQFNGISYHAYREEPVGRSLGESDLGPEFARVEHVVPADDPDYEVKDGDAAFLREGTPVYTVEGYEPEFRLAVLKESRVSLYEVTDNPEAKKGADVLDIGSRVRSITVSNTTIPGNRGEELATIEGQEHVADLVEMVLEAPVVREELGEEGEEYIVSFHLRDGTTVERSYWPESDEMSWKFESSWRIPLPWEFRTVIDEAKGRVAQ
jgi:hypothetical protein